MTVSTKQIFAITTNIAISKIALIINKAIPTIVNDKANFNIASTYVHFNFFLYQNLCWKQSLAHQILLR